MGFNDAFTRSVRRGLDLIPDEKRMKLQTRRAEFNSIGQLKANVEMLTMRLAELERLVHPAEALHPELPDDRFPDGVRSVLCHQEHIDQPWFQAVCEEIGVSPTAHRKTWEFAYVFHVLDVMGLLASGKRGLGFGVGKEPTIAALAARGVSITATDLESEDREAKGWAMTGQHTSNGADDLHRPEIIDLDTFRSLTTWRDVDMRNIPQDLQGYDFCWSACSLEHLGTLDLGLEFIENSLKTLAPGGIAVHTTEFNLTSNDDTFESGPTVVYRQKDIEAFVARLEAAGHEVAAVDFHQGTKLLDKYVDIAPYAEEPVLRFRFGAYELTSIALVIRKRIESS